MKLNKLLGNYDLTQFVSLAVASANAAFKHPVYTVPNLKSLAGFATLNVAPGNGIKVRGAYLIPETTFTGVITNNITLKLQQYRAGAVHATIASLVVDATVTLTAFEATLIDAGLASQNWEPGDVLVVEADVNGTGETLPAMTILVSLDAVR